MAIKHYCDFCEKHMDGTELALLLQEAKEKFPKQEVYFHGYNPDYTVNGEEVCICYWGDNANWCGWGIEGSQLPDWGEITEAQKWFAHELAKKPHVVVEGQEVWT